MSRRNESIRSGGSKKSRNEGRLHGTRTYALLNPMFQEWYDDPDRDRGSAPAKSKSRSKSATLSQLHIQGQKQGLWRTKQVNLQLPSVSSRKLLLWLAGSDEELDFIESVFLPLLNEAAAKVPDHLQGRYQRYLDRLLDMCVRLAASDTWNNIAFDSDEEKKVFRYNLWLLGSACIQLLDHLGVDVENEYGKQSVFKTVYPLYFAKAPIAKDLPEHKKKSSKKWWRK